MFIFALPHNVFVIFLIVFTVFFKYCFKNIEFEALYDLNKILYLFNSYVQNVSHRTGLCKL